MTTQFYIRLDNFTKPNNDLGSRCYTSEPHNQNLAALVASYCENQRINCDQCGMLIFETRKAWMSDYEIWHSQCRKGYPVLDPLA